MTRRLRSPDESSPPHIQNQLAQRNVADTGYLPTKLPRTIRIQPSNHPPHRIICLLIPSVSWKKAEASSRCKHGMFRSRTVEIEVMGYFPHQSLVLRMTVGINIYDLNGRFCKRQNIQSYLSINYIVICRKVFTKRDRSTMPMTEPPKNRQGRKAQRNHQLQANLT